MNITRPVYIRQLVHKALLFWIFWDFLAILIEFEAARFNLFFVDDFFVKEIESCGFKLN
jgi:hypothetical protein